MPHYAKRKDNGQDAIVEGLKARGIAVVPMPDPGDILCFHPDAWRFLPIEIKTPRPTRGAGAGGSHGLTKKQIKTRLAGVHIPVVKSLGEALALFGLQE